MKNPEEHAKRGSLPESKRSGGSPAFFVIVTNDVSGDQGAYSEETEEYRNLLGESILRWPGRPMKCMRSSAEFR